MNRIHQIDPTEATGKTQQLFEIVKGKFGRIPNAVRVLGNSPVSLEAYLGVRDALSKGVLPPKIREQLALTVGEINGCSYCVSAHTFQGGKAGLTSEEISKARRATGTDDKSDAVLKLARSIALKRGQVSDSELQAARVAGLNDGEIVEVVLQVAMNTMTNYLNNVARTAIDFPEVKPGDFQREPELAAQNA